MAGASPAMTVAAADLTRFIEGDRPEAGAELAMTGSQMGVVDSSIVGRRQRLFSPDHSAAPLWAKSDAIRYLSCGGCAIIPEICELRG
jgi:hypothetical protein